MDDSSFSQTVVEAAQAKAEWFDREALPDVLENYRLLHSCVKTIFDFLVKKSLITPDPYKLDKKISDIKAPENTVFADGERAMVIGMRFSDYESTLDFVSNYYKFSVSNVTLPQIKKMVDFNASFLWNAFTPNSQKPNTRGLAELVFRARQNLDALTNSLITDSLGKASAALTDITRQLKELTEFQKEHYKAQVRQNVLGSPNCDSSKIGGNPADELAQIKKHFAAAMGKIPFYNDLIDEIVQEDTAPNKTDLQNAVLAKLSVSVKETKKKEVQVDTKDMVMGTLRVLGSLPGLLESVYQKLNDNHELLESEHNSLVEKLARLLKKSFGIQEKPQFYTILVGDATTESKRREKINFQQFMSELSARTRRLASVSVKGAPGYERVSAQSEEKILEFATAQIAECNKMIKHLAGLDEFFKNTAASENKAKVKGVKMEIISIKNCVVKANQVRAEYAAYVEEAEQMKKLGISNEI